MAELLRWTRPVNQGDWSQPVNQIFQRAMFEKKQDGRMILDQEGLMRAWHDARHMVPENLKHDVSTFMKQALDHFCSFYPQPASFRDWIKLHNLEKVFFVNQTTQDDRYSAIIEDLTTKENETLHRERDFTYMMKVFREREKHLQAVRALPEAMDLCKKYSRALNCLVKTDRKVRNRRDTDQDEAACKRIEELGCFAKGFKEYVWNPSWNIDIREGLSMAPVLVKVKTRISAMSYYCGYSPGSYIFRFENPRQFGNTYQFEIADLVHQESGGLGPRQQQYFQQLLDVQKEQWREWNQWNDAELKMEKREYSRLLSDARSGQWNNVRFGDTRRHDLETRVLEYRPERDRKNFTYCGFVPRHPKEHMARLKEIHRRVLHIIVATLTFAEWPASAGNPDSVVNIGPRMNEITPSDLRLIRWYWDLHFPKNQPFPEELRNVFRESLVVTEFVDLMAMMPFQIAPGLVQLFAMVLQATDMTMEEMVVLEAMRQAETGLNLLLSDFKEDRFFVFQDARIRADNILELHHHFAQESFTLDPNHPRRQYNTTADPDLAEKVQKTCAVLRSINQDWEKDLRHSSLVENAVRQAQSRKRPLDRKEGVAQETQPRTRLFKPSACTQDAAPETQPCSWPFASLSRARDATLETLPRNRLFASLACAQVAAQVTQPRNRTFKSLVCANGLFESDPDAEYPETIDPKVLRFDPLLSQNDCAKPKRPRGRPPGRKNDKTIARENKARQRLEAEDSDISTH